MCSECAPGWFQEISNGRIFIDFFYCRSSNTPTLRFFGFKYVFFFFTPNFGEEKTQLTQLTADELQKLPRSNCLITGSFWWKKTLISPHKETGSGPTWWVILNYSFVAGPIGLNQKVQTPWNEQREKHESGPATYKKSSLDQVFKSPSTFRRVCLLVWGEGFHP